MVIVTQYFCLRLGKNRDSKFQVIFRNSVLLRDAFAQITRQLVCLSIKFEQHSGLTECFNLYSY